MKEIEEKLRLAEEENWIVLIITKNNTQYVGKVKVHDNFDLANGDRNVAIYKEGSPDVASIGIRRHVKEIHRVEIK